MKVNSQKTTQFPQLCDQRPKTNDPQKIENSKTSPKNKPTEKYQKNHACKKKIPINPETGIYYRETKRFTLNTRESKKDKVVGGQ